MVEQIKEARMGEIKSGDKFGNIAKCHLLTSYVRNILPLILSATKGWRNKYGQLNLFLGSFVKRPCKKL